MEELSRIIIEEYCRKHNSAKSRRLARLVRMSYDLSAEFDDDDAIFLDKAIQSEKNDELREALEDLDDFMFGW